MIKPTPMLYADGTEIEDSEYVPVPLSRDTAGRVLTNDEARDPAPDAGRVPIGERPTAIGSCPLCGDELKWINPFTGRHKRDRFDTEGCQPTRNRR